MLSRVSLFLIGLIFLVVFDSKARAGFALPDSLAAPAAGCCEGAGKEESGDDLDGSAPGTWQFFFKQVCEASAPACCGAGSSSPGPLPLPELPCLNDSEEASPESITGLLCRSSVTEVTPYVCRLFRPPRGEHF